MHYSIRFLDAVVVLVFTDSVGRWSELIARRTARIIFDRLQHGAVHII